MKMAEILYELLKLVKIEEIRKIMLESEEQQQ